MGVKYKYRKEFYFDGNTSPREILGKLKPFQKEDVILEFTKPCMHYEQLSPLKGSMMFSVTIAAKESELISGCERELIEVFEKANCKLIRSNPTVYTFKEDGMWQRKEIL